MAQCRVVANDTDMGVFEGETSSEALDAYARDAGYKEGFEAMARELYGREWAERSKAFDEVEVTRVEG